MKDPTHPQNFLRTCALILFVLALVPAARAQEDAMPNLAHPNAFSSGKSTLPQSVRAGEATLVERYPARNMLRVAFALKPQHVAEQEQLLRDLQNPDSPNFHRFLTLDEWIERFAPSEADEQAVINWAEGHGLTITHRYNHRLVVNAEAPVAVLERAFNVQINRYRTPDAAFFSNDREIELPEDLSELLTGVLGLDNFDPWRPASAENPSVESGPDYLPGPLVRSGGQAAADADGSWVPGGMNVPYTNTGAGVHPDSLPAGGIDPATFYSAAAYDYDGLQNLGHCCNPLGNPGHSPKESSIAVFVATDYNLSDIANFHSWFPYLAYNVEKKYIDGTPACCSDLEPYLDVEWLTATANSFHNSADTAKIYTYGCGTLKKATHLDVISQMAHDDLARVMSSSYGGHEPAPTDDLTTTMGFHNLFTTMSLTGWTIVYASGDEGAAGDCKTKSVRYPSSDPNVIAVGGTWLELNSSNGFNTEVAWTGGTAPGSCAANDGGSTGGCSRLFKAPPYQTTPACGVNSRSYPDISLNAQSMVYVSYFGGPRMVGGTSASGPEMAGFFAQENAYLLSFGKKCNGQPCAPLGDLHQALYQIGYGGYKPAHYPFYDITKGCNSNDVANASLGYYCAGPGYDLVTGWGAANMLQLAWALNAWETRNRVPVAPTLKWTLPANTCVNDPNAAISWAATANPSSSTTSAAGIAGSTFAWSSSVGTADAYLGDRAHISSAPAYFSGPMNPGVASGSPKLSSQGQGWHTLYVMAWDNDGSTTGLKSSGTFCYDTVPPVTTASLQNGTLGILAYLVLTANDATSGVAYTKYSLDGGTLKTYTGSVPITTTGKHTANFYSVNKAGNQEKSETYTFTIR